MELADCEGTAARIYREAGADPADPPGPVALARAWLGAGALERAPRGALLTDAASGTVAGRRRIVVRAGLPPVRLAWAVAHELAELALAEERYRAPDVEAVADTVAACLLAPPATVRAVGRGPVPAAVAEVADALVLTDTCAALRLGEVLDVPLAVIAPLVRVRGAAFAWPDEAGLRQLARRGGPGLVRARCRDDARRAIVAVSDDAAGA